ncbi:MAG: hypothetical protein JXR12_05910 [Neptunomonas phycophila]|uniref:hypothetical protein n=1 Tax=Neptunomonas phycophila TaxID=1572645 RepID=UPI003B8C0B02
MFQSDYSIIPSSFKFEPSYLDFDGIPTLSHCDIAFAREHGGEYVNNIINEILILNEFDPNRLKITVLNQRFSTGGTSIRPGWHSDWYSHSPVDYGEKRMAIFWFGSNVAPTEFYTGPLHDVALNGNESIPEDDFYSFRDALVNKAIETYDCDVHVSSSNTIYELKPNTIHRPVPATGGGRRVLVKIEESDRPALNRKLETTTVYMPAPTLQYDKQLNEYL